MSNPMEGADMDRRKQQGTLAEAVEKATASRAEFLRKHPNFVAERKPETERLPATTFEASRRMSKKKSEPLAELVGEEQARAMRFGAAAKAAAERRKISGSDD